MSQETNPEDLTILAAIEALERGDDPSVARGPRGDETAETLARLYTEVLGLYSSELEPVAPRPEAKERLLEAIGAAPARRADEPRSAPEPRPVPAPSVAVPVPPAAPAATSPFPLPTPEQVRPPQQPRPVTADAPKPALPDAPRPYSPAPRPGPVPRRQSRWPLALAASLAVLFAGTTAWLWMERTDQGARRAELLDVVEAQRRRADEAVEEAEQLRNEMNNMRQRYTLVTSPSVEVMPLRPVGDQPRARGMLFVAQDHQHWYLAIEGLEPAGAGAVYQLWWVTDQGVESGGIFTAESGEKIQMSSDEMPAGTRQAVVTFEPAGIVPAPTGPQVLRAGP